MSANEPYRLFVTSRTSGQFNYNAQLLGPDGQQVSTTWTDTVWGAKRWAKKQARKHMRRVARHEFEVRP